MGQALNPTPPPPPRESSEVLTAILSEGVTWADAGQWFTALPSGSLNLTFTSPPYADARAYSKIHPDRYVEWFLPHARALLAATKEDGWLVININNRVASSGPFRGQRHPYVFQTAIALQHMGWRLIETYIWAKPNAMPGRFGPRTKDAFEYVFAFAKGQTPYWNLDAIRVPYKATPEEIARRKLDKNGRGNTDAGFGRDRTKTYLHGGADPGNVISVPQTYNQHYGPAGSHTAVMPEGVADFFVKAATPPGSVVLDPFAGSGTTVVVARRLGRVAGGLELCEDYVQLAKERLRIDGS